MPTLSDRPYIYVWVTLDPKYFWAHVGVTVVVERSVSFESRGRLTLSHDALAGETTLSNVGVLGRSCF